MRGGGDGVERRGEERGEDGGSEGNDEYLYELGVLQYFSSP